MTLLAYLSYLLVYVEISNSRYIIVLRSYALQELGFDYLRDNLSRNKEQLVMRWYILRLFTSLRKIVLSIFLLFLIVTSLFHRPRPFHFAIVDEVDSVLIDEGRNPLLISGEVWSVSPSWTWFLQWRLGFFTCVMWHNSTSSSCHFSRIIEMQLGIQLLLKSQNFLWRVLWVFYYCQKLHVTTVHSSQY